MSKKEITLRQGWLHFPIGRNAQRYYVRLSANGKPLGHFHMGIASQSPDFFCGMELTKHIGETILLETDEGAPANLLDGVREGGGMAQEHDLYPALYHEALRPQYHFSSRRGWLNDPNGLFFDGESYHLYYQHNPYGIVHGGVNIHWGHAVSPDAVHWTEYPDALRPTDELHHIASGSCIVDAEGAAGFGANTVIAAYTSLGSMNYRLDPPAEGPGDGQYLAYSTDGGMRFTPFAENPVIPSENGKSWRDPRLFAMSDGRIGIAVYETTERGNCVTFYTSPDYHHWTLLSRTDDLYECPDLFKLDTPDHQGEKWVLYGADSMYRIGEFTDAGFEQQYEKRPLDYGRCAYAGQTWNHHPSTAERLHISWLRDEKLSWIDTDSYAPMPFSQCMTVPCALTLAKADDGYRLDRYPIAAVDKLRTAVTRSYHFTQVKEAELELFLHGDTELYIAAHSPVTVSIGSSSFVYDPATGEAVFDQSKRAVLRHRGVLALRILTDSTSCEFFLQKEISASYGINMAGERLHIIGSFSLEGNGFEMRSIWA